MLDRRFSPVSDWVYFGPGIGVLADSVGQPLAVVAAAVAVGLVVVLLVVLPLAAGRLTRVAVRASSDDGAGAHRAAAVVWVLCAVAGLQAGPVGRVASTSAAGLAVDQVQQVRADLARPPYVRRRDRADRMGDGARAPAAVGAARQGRAARLRRELRPGRRAGLVVLRRASTPCSRTGRRRLRAAGYSARSAFLTSPTFGAASWLAHATLQSGLWVDSERRYDQLLDADRLTLTDAFGGAGWRTVFDVPANTRGLAGGRGVLRFRPDVRLPQRRLRGSGVRLRRRCRTSTRSSTSAARSWRPATVRR